MRVVYWHLMRSMLLAALLVLVAMTALMGLFALMEELSDADASYRFVDAFAYVGLTLPRRMLEILPYAIFLGALIGLGTLASQSELVVLRSAGMSAWQIFYGVAAAAILLLLVGLWFGEQVAPAAEARAELLKNQRQQGSESSALVGGYWFRQGDMYMNIDALGDDGSLRGLQQFFFEPDRSLTQARSAELAEFSENGGGWELKNTNSSTFGPEVVAVKRSQTDLWPVSLDVQGLSTRMLMDPQRMSVRDLLSQIQYMQQEDLSVTRYQLAFWVRVQQPLAVLGLALLALCFVLGPLRQVSLGVRVSTGILIGLGFKYLQDLFAPMSLVYGLDPAVAVALPIALCWIVALVTLRRVG